MINERTLVLLKPDAVARGLIGEIISRFERVGLKIVGMKMLFAPKEILEEHYKKDDAWLIEKGKGIIKNKGYSTDYDPKLAGKEIVDALVEDNRILPIVAMVIEGHNAVAVVKKLTGPTNVREALPGTIRGDYSHDTYDLANILDRPIITVIHCTGEKHEAEKEINLWFNPEELYKYEKPDATMHYRKRNVEQK